MPFTLGGDFISHDDVNKQEKAKKPIRVTKERRKNVIVTLIHNVPYDQQELKALLKDLKTKLGVGGSIKDEVIQLQGDHVEKVKPLLAKLRKDLG